MAHRYIQAIHLVHGLALFGMDGGRCMVMMFGFLLLCVFFFGPFGSTHIPACLRRLEIVGAMAARMNEWVGSPRTEKGVCAGRAMSCKKSN